ncbi:ABC-transporter substrate-binding protein [Marinibacterium anthonyi]|nr:ABC-transporter substrate-binding protein [Marinibacterium anthonyi]
MTNGITRRTTLKMAAASLAAAAAPGALLAQSGTPLVLAVDAITTLDPAFTRATGGNLSICSQVMSSLTTITATGELVGDLATSWEVDSPTQFTFHLNPDAKFENGKPLDASVIAWNFARMMDPDLKATADTDFDLIDRVEAPDPHTAVFYTKSPWLELPRRMSWFFFLEPEWAASHNPKVEVMSSGAYKVVSFDPGGDVVLQANPGFHGAAPSIPNVTYRSIGNAAARISGLRGGEIHASLRIDPIDLAQLQGLPDYDVGAKEGQRYHVMKFHFGHEPLQDIRVRQAINYAINKDAITKAVFRGYVGPGTTQVLNPQTPGFDDTMTPWPYDPEKARALLAEAGYGDGLKLTLKTSAEGSSLSVSPITQIVAAQLKEVGIDLEVVLLPYSAYLALRTQPEEAPDLTYAGYVSQSNSAIELFGQYSQQGPYAWGEYPPAFGEGIEAARSATDEDTQIQTIKDTSGVMLDTVMEVFLWIQPQTYAIHKKLNWMARTDDWIKAADMSWS